MLDNFKSRMARQGGAQNKAYLKQSDMIIDATFTRDPAYRKVFLTHAPSDIYNVSYDAKYLVNSYYNITKDEVDYYIQFRPHVQVPIGSYVDIPDDNDVLERWLIVAYDDRPQFPLYYILKCNWTLKWVCDGKVYKVLGALRNQNSYNSGVWTDYLTTSVENQNKFWMPTTPYTQKINYNQRFLINDKGREIPIAWMVSKVEDVQPVGITKLTFAQQLAILHEDCGKYGIANWCKCTDHTAPKSEVCKVCTFEEPKYIDAAIELPKPELPRGKITYNGKDATLRVGGSAKTLTAMFWDAAKHMYIEHKPTWKLSYMDGESLLCSLVLNFNNTSWDIKLSDDCPSNIKLEPLKFNDDIATTSNVDGCTITCSSNSKEIFKIHVAPADDNIKALKLRCLQLYDMVCKTIVVSAQNSLGEDTMDIKMEVVS